MSDHRAEWEAEVLASDLPDNLTRAAWALRKLANKDGECWPSVTTLSATYGKDRETTYRHLKKLEEAGWIRREQRGGALGQGGTTNKYYLTFPESGRTSVSPRPYASRGRA